jgi:hypothetical protein
VHRVAADETAWPWRDVTWSMVIAGVDPDPGIAGDLVRWGRDYWAAVQPYGAGGAYVNFMMADEGEARVRATYGTNFDRLGTTKARYDPENVFRVNQNIPPERA